MPGEDQYIKLPDGSYVHVPATATPDQLAQLHNKLATQYSDLKTGRGMMEKAQGQNTEKAKGTLNNATPSYSAMALENSPSGADPHNAGNPNLNAVPPSERDAVNSTALRTAIATTPMVGPFGKAVGEGMPAVLRLGRGMLGSGVGGVLGAKAGADVGGLMGPTGREVGGILGGLGGGTLGGGMAAGLERSPTTMRIKSLPFGIQRAIPEWMVPGGVPEDEVAKAGFMNKGYKPAAIAAKQSSLSAPMEQAPVMHVREPLPLAPGEKPGSMYSIPREHLEGLAKTGKPGALDTLRDLGRKALVIPEGAGEYPGPRAKIAVPDVEPDDEE